MQNPVLVPRPHGCEGPIWEALISDPGASTLVVSQQGELLWINPQAAKAFPILAPPAGDSSPGSPDLPLDSRLEARLPAPIAAELKVAISNVINSGQPQRFRFIWLGKQLLAWIHELNESGADIRQLLITVRHQGGVFHHGGSPSDPPASEAPDTTSLHMAATNHMGELDVLTRRELQVLAMIGQGLSIKRIAFELKRSEKTVENHRRAIGQKLNARDRVQLAHLAHEAGLTAEDAQRDRISVKRQRDSSAG